MGFLKSIVKACIGKNDSNKKDECDNHIALDIKSSFTSHEVIPVQIKPKAFYNYQYDDLFYIRNNIVTIRRDKKITQKQISECLGFKSTSYISRFESGDVQEISHKQLDDFANCLGVETNELLKGYEKH